MKKLIYIGLMLGYLILLSSNTKAQYYYTSYGYAHNWHLPKYIEHSIYDNYYGYDIAHVYRYNRSGYTNFNVLLHRNGWFVELRFDRHGHIYKAVQHRWHYPLISHNCTHHCGFHHIYYKTYYPKYHPRHHQNFKTVYINTQYGNRNNYNQKYYTNVHIEKHSNQKFYNGNNSADRKGQSTIQRNRKQQHRGITTVVRKPQPTNNGNDKQRRSEMITSSNGLRQGKEMSRNTRQISRTNNSGRTMVYKNGHGTQNR